MSLYLISKNGAVTPWAHCTDLSALARSQPRIDAKIWGNTAYTRRRKFRVIAGSVKGESMEMRIHRAAVRAAQSPNTKRNYLLCLDEKGNLEELLPVSNAITLDLQESFGVRVLGFRHAKTQQSKAFLTVLASPEQIHLIRQAYPQIKIVEEQKAS